MSIDLVINAPKTPARLASIESMRLAMAGDAERWLDLFAEDAVLQDPYGVSPMDPTGKGHRGRTAIEAFWDRQIAPNRVIFHIRHSYAAGSEVANVGTITVVLPNGVVSVVEGVFTYRVDEAGKVLALRAYWETDAMSVIPAAEE